MSSLNMTAGTQLDHCHHLLILLIKSTRHDITGVEHINYGAWVPMINMLTQNKVHRSIARALCQAGRV